MQLRCRLVLLWAMLWFAGLGALAQQGGSIGGSVLDPTGAVVRNASVTLTSTAQGTERNVKTDDRGQYYFPDVQPGTYKLSVMAPAFELYTFARTLASPSVRYKAKLL